MNKNINIFRKFDPLGSIFLKNGIAQLPKKNCFINKSYKGETKFGPRKLLFTMVMKENNAISMVII